jgi:hypothetical protein
MMNNRTSVRISGSFAVHHIGEAGHANKLTVLPAFNTLLQPYHAWFIWHYGHSYNVRSTDSEPTRRQTHRCEREKIQ